MLKSLKKIFANTSLNNTNEKFILSNNKEEHIFVLKYKDNAF